MRQKLLILTLPDNKNQAFNMPSHAKLNINGKEKTVSDLRKGMMIKATIVTDEEHTIVESSKIVYGQAARVTMPHEVGVLLFAMTPLPQVTLARAEEPADTLPETRSSQPLIGLLGTFAIAILVALGIVRRSYAL